MYQTEIQQMMFVFGEVQDSLDETTNLVEQIIRSQLINLIANAVTQSQLRGSKHLAAEDLIFLIRHNKQKVNRLRSFLTWKEVRKNVKDKEGADEDDQTDDAKPKVKKISLKFSWDHLNTYSSILEEDDDDEADEEDRQAYSDQISRLRIADTVTRSMTQDEYIYYAECRQASFTYKKLKKFREWCEMARYYDTKANSDIIDSLGFLCHEAVSTLTKLSLEIKSKEDLYLQSLPMTSGITEDATPSLFQGLFQKPVGERGPLLKSHVEEAYRILQKNTNPLHAFKSGVIRNSVHLI